MRWVSDCICFWHQCVHYGKVDKDKICIDARATDFQNEFAFDWCKVFDSGYDSHMVIDRIVSTQAQIGDPEYHECLGWAIEGDRSTGNSWLNAVIIGEWATMSRDVGEVERQWIVRNCVLLRWQCPKSEKCTIFKFGRSAAI